VIATQQSSVLVSAARAVFVPHSCSGDAGVWLVRLAFDPALGNRISDLAGATAARRMVPGLAIGPGGQEAGNACRVGLKEKLPPGQVPCPDSATCVQHTAVKGGPHMRMEWW
jgi:hypothetical protein